MPEHSETTLTPSMSRLIETFMDQLGEATGQQITAASVESHHHPHGIWIVTTTTPQGNRGVWLVPATKDATP